MQAKAELPKAFSVRDEHGFLPIQHLMARLNPKLMVKQVATDQIRERFGSAALRRAAAMPRQRDGQNY